MNYNTLRQAIAAAVRTPADPKISGSILQQQLLGIVNALDMGALYMGTAETSTRPDTEANGFYLALTAGTYANFTESGGTAIALGQGEIALIVRSGSAWAKVHVTTTPYIDPSSKHWIVDGHDSGIVAEGQDGTDGTNGITPHIDPNTKHWMIGDTDTGIIAEGQSDDIKAIDYSEIDEITGDSAV